VINCATTVSRDLILQDSVRKTKESCVDLMVAHCTITEFFTKIRNQADLSDSRSMMKWNLHHLPRMSWLNIYKISQNGAISIQTLICNVLLGKKKRGTNVKTVVLIDSGSSVTCIDKDFALEHNLQILGRREGMTLHMLQRIVKLPEDQFQVELQLSSVDQGCTKNITAWTVKNLAGHTAVVDWSERKKQFPHLKNIKFPEMPEDSTIKIVMGVDNTALYAAVKIVPNDENDTDPIAIKLLLGWTCVGRSSPSPYKNEVFTNVVFRPKN
jgi:hypothetical protein